MPLSPLIAFRADVIVEEGKSAALLKHGSGEISLKDATPVLMSAFRTLASGGATVERLSGEVKRRGDRRDLRLLHYYLDLLSRRLLICYPLVVQGQRFLTLEPVGARFYFSASQAKPDAAYRLSRFAICRRESAHLVVETPLSLARVSVNEPVVAAMVAELASSTSCRELSHRMPGLSEAVAGEVLTYLLAAGLISEVGDDGAIGEEKNGPLMLWELHDLLFHSRSRLGRQAYPVGADFRFLGKLEPLPAVKPRMSQDVVTLYKPDIESLEKEDPSFTSVLEDRKSMRAYGAPISARQLGEFLYRVARVRKVRGPDPRRGLFYEVSSRPYPSGGAAYELEIYLTISACPPIPRGIYHYNALRHELSRISDKRFQSELLLRDAWWAAGKTVVPQVLITVTSRFQRLSWKYSGIAYATTLKNVGVLFHSMYLVATAMGLAPCALGGGNSDLFAEAVELDSLAEVSVGEFMLGTSPERHHKSNQADDAERDGDSAFEEP